MLYIYIYIYIYIPLGKVWTPCLSSQVLVKPLLVSTRIILALNNPGKLICFQNRNQLMKRVFYFKEAVRNSLAPPKLFKLWINVLAEPVVHVCWISLYRYSVFNHEETNICSNKVNVEWIVDWIHKFFLLPGLKTISDLRVIRWRWLC